MRENDGSGKELIDILNINKKIVAFYSSPYKSEIPGKKHESYSYHIRIYHECEGRIEKSVKRIAVWHHEACQVMTNGDPEGHIFLSYPHTNNGFFFFLTHVFNILK